MNASDPNSAFEKMSGDAVLKIVREAAEEFVASLRVIESSQLDSTDGLSLDDREKLFTALRRLLARLESTGYRGETNRLPSGELWRAAEPWISRGVLQRRAREKPRGYAGDYEMLNMIALRTLCDDPWGNAFDQFFQDEAAPRAVRERLGCVTEAIIETMAGRGDTHAVHVVSIGCGPAIDIRWAAERLSAEERRRLRVTLLDLDPAAIEFAKASLEPLLPAAQIDCRRENLYRLPRRREAAGLVDADFVACAGLFDYLEPADAAALLRAMWDSLRPGGRLQMFNFLTTNPSRPYMEWIGNWYLCYRTLDELAELARAAKLPTDASRVITDSANVVGRIEATKISV
ncbi:MAG: class I SAM-dependent methyltransferase [Planctomycetales bacterium]|nr:class I SAM-dependent methyltransferase [Planctomycetales bacterium]